MGSSRLPFMKVLYDNGFLRYFKRETTHISLHSITNERQKT